MDELAEKGAAVSKDPALQNQWADAFDRDVVISNKISGLMKARAKLFGVSEANTQRRLLYVDKPSKFKLKVSKRGIDKTRQSVWADGANEFRKMVGEGLIDNKTIQIKTPAGAAKKKLPGRAYAEGNTAFIPKRRGIRTIIHEMGHVLEKLNPDAHKKALEFLHKRTEGEKLELLSKLTGDSQYNDDEVTRPDKFLSPYMGKEYKHKGEEYATEIISMGMEYMWDDPARFAREDPEYFDFIYNLLRGN